ncbi:MAG: hypothetical protein QXQ90_00985 [Desulfurococcaceae archaeon]
MYSGVYGLVLHYLSTLPREALSKRVFVDRRNAVIVVSESNYLLVMQVTDEHLFNYLVETGSNNPDHLVDFFKSVERSTRIPSTISVVRVAKKDLEKFTSMIAGGKSGE